MHLLLLPGVAQRGREILFTQLLMPVEASADLLRYEEAVVDARVWTAKNSHDSFRKPVVRKNPIHALNILHDKCFGSPAARLLWTSRLQ